MNKGLPITRRGLLSAGGCAGVGLTLPPLFSGCDNTPQASGTVYQTRMNLTAEERDQLESLARRRKTHQALAMRAKIVLRCAEGFGTSTSRICRHISS